MTNENEDPHPLDVALGARIRLRRNTMVPKMSQDALARTIGITFQQVQKYETAANRVSFSRLAQIANALGCSIADLVEGLMPTKRKQPPTVDTAPLLNAPGAVDLLRNYGRIDDPQDRRAVAALARKLSAAHTRRAA